jgi:thiol-disulfide isomerase/thioredoxin
MNSARWILGVVFFSLGTVNFYQILAQDAELIGSLTLSEIIENDPIFEIYMDRYQPEENSMTYLRNYQDSVEVVVFYGSWCRESRKYLPGLVKTLHEAGNDRVKVRYIGVDRKKKFPEEFLNKHQIKYIPTVVVLKGNAETGRIVEKPRERIETDLVEILGKATAKK